MNLDDLKSILKLVEEAKISEFEFEEGGTRLRIRKEGDRVAQAASAPAPSSPPPEPAGGEGAAEAPPETGVSTVQSPIVGTFYRASGPEAEPFANVGDRVRVGQVLCIVEAMKLMNEIEADVAGEIVKVHPANGQPVQYGAPLFDVRSDG